MGKDAAMSADRSEISSIESTLSQLVDRVVSLAHGAERERDDRTAGDLFAVERALVTARRRLERLLTERA
ncbi:MAG: hypothetical protein JWM85_1396 [Acidimicrobiaceae bacterium]|nr:hypothetical protein [Acidimicrobiaceae bacterium]